MTKPMVRIHNAETDEVIDREMTAEEFNDYEAKQSQHTAEQAETEKRAVAKSVLLDRLGITADEAALLLG